MNDAEKRMRNELEGVFNTYGVPFEHVRRSNHYGYQFEVNGKKLLFVYGNGDYRAVMNARSDLRNLLKNSGCIQVTDAEPVLNEEPQLEPAPEQEPDVVTIETEPPMLEPESETPLPTEPTEEEPEIAVSEEEGVALSSPELEPIMQEIKPVRGHTYQSDRVLGIKLSHDLLVTHGNVLVIPLTNPAALFDMTEEQFKLIFNKVVEELPLPTPRTPRTTRTTKEEAPPSASVPAVVETSPPPPHARSLTEYVLDYLKTRNGAVKVPTIAEALNITIKSADYQVRKLVAEGFVERGPPGFFSLVDTPSPQLKLVPRPGRGIRGPVPAQIGRILAAMVQASKATGRHDLQLSHVQPYLDLRDLRQYAARMPGAADKGWVEKGLPDGNRHCYKITTSGQSMVKQVGTWPWTAEGLQVPQWVMHLLA